MDITLNWGETDKVQWTPIARNDSLILYYLHENEWNRKCSTIQPVIIKLLRLILMYKCTCSTLGYQLELVLGVCIRKINWKSDVENSVNKLWNRWPLNSEIIATAKGPSFFFSFLFAPWHTMVKYDQRLLILSQLGAGEDLTKVDQFLAVWVFVCLWLTFLFESHLKQWSHTPLFPNGPLVSLGWPPLMIDPTDVEHGGV